MHEKERRYLQHLRLTQASKHTYYRQRTIATLRWPHFELFLTVDGGTGTTYHLPRQSR